MKCPINTQYISVCGVYLITVATDNLYYYAWKWIVCKHSIYVSHYSVSLWTGWSESCGDDELSRKKSIDLLSISLSLVIIQVLLGDIFVSRVRSLDHVLSNALLWLGSLCTHASLWIYSINLSHMIAVCMLSSSFPAQKFTMQNI